MSFDNEEIFAHPYRFVFEVVQVFLGLCFTLLLRIQKPQITRPITRRKKRICSLKHNNLLPYLGICIVKLTKIEGDMYIEKQVMPKKIVE